MKATTVLRWVIALFLLGTITRNLLAQPPSESPDLAYPWAEAEQADPYPWETTEPVIVRLSVAETPEEKSKLSRGAAQAESVAQPFVPSPEVIATARRYAEYVEMRLLSNEGWWK